MAVSSQRPWVTLARIHMKTTDALRRRFAPCPCELIQSLIGGLYKNSPHQWDISGIVLGIESNPSMMRAHWLSLIHETLSFNQQNWCFLMGYSGDATGRDLDVCVSNLFASSWNRGNLDAKIHQFCQLQEKKILNGYFHSRMCFVSLFRMLPKAFLKACFHSRTSEGSRAAPKSTFVGFGLDLKITLW